MILKTGMMAPDTGSGNNVGAGKGAIHGQAGFSLIELMIAIFVLTIGVLAVCSMQISGMNGNTAARQYTDYATLAMDQLETLMGSPYDSLPTDGANNGNVANGATGLFTTNNTADQVIPGGDYNIYVNVAPNALMNNTTTVSIIVAWNNAGTPRRFSLQGVIPQTS